ncbi:thioredoxin TrxC [Aurantiacibacter poecillastricola]|uniref:thioredoxin TrxC n=1 Tax=Aurantiacibacter poecillastricola TaxID=3064385 RepID=UPI00273E66F9|nr:thioredoxin TrxC [Aurantiacibacter sp. 219JJ12-13]MDP5261118.1 thioredoxin TrxC [Aurantiacibacter sp. 219JJ12-13]
MSKSMHLVCPSCGAINRVPTERLGEGPVCGKCRQPLMPGEPVEIGAAQLARAIARSDVPMVVDFWAPWCGPCRTMAPEFARAAAQMKGRALFLKCNTEEHPQAGRAHQVQSIPLLCLFAGGREVDRLMGARPASAITGWVTSHL